MRKMLLSLSLAAVVLACCAGAAAPAPLIQVSPKTTMVWLGAHGSIGIMVNDGIENIMGWDVTARFDPALISIDSVVAGSFSHDAGRASFFVWLNPSCGCDSVCINGSILGDVLDGPFTLFRIYFTGVGLGVANIGIAKSDLRDGENRRIAHDYEDGIVIVAAPTGENPPMPVEGEIVNYPNPFNPSTVIMLSMPRAAAGSNVELAVYSASGRRVRSLFSGSLDGDRGVFMWDGRDDAGRTVAAGFYVAVARAGETALQRKMILIR